jgi:hypothetical protein
MSETRRLAALALVGMVCLLSVPRTQSATWAMRFGGASPDTGSAVAVDAAGNIYTAGTFIGTATFGTNTLTSAGLGDIFLMKTASDGALQWVHRFGSTGDEWVQRMILDASGNIYLCGGFKGSGSFGGGATVSAGDVDGYIAKYSSTGTFLWSRTVGGSGTDQINGIALDASQQHLIAIGLFQGTVVFTPSTTFSSQFGGADSFLSEYSVVDGSPIWARTWGGIDYDSGLGVFTDASDNIFVVGWFAFQINLGSGVIAVAGTGQRDVYIGKFASNGTNAPGASLWSFRYGTVNTTTPFCAALDGNGDLTVCGTFKNQTDVGTGALTGGGLSSTFVAKYSGATGTGIWSRSIVSNGSVTPYGVSFDTFNNPVICGSYDTFCNFGSQTFTSAGSLDIFAAKYDGGSGSPVWAQSFGGTSTDGATAVSVDGSNATIVTGYFTGGVNFGGIPLTAAGANDVFLLRMQPATTPIHYVDPTATGANDGSSWADAWTSFAAINWASVNPDDIVYLSGGTTSQAYTGTFTIAKSGTAGHPITVKIGQDPGHTGIAVLSGNYVDLAGRSYVTLDGNFSGTNHITLSNFFDPVNRTLANKVYADSSVGIRVQYCNFDNVNQCVSLVGASGFNINHNSGTNIRGDAAVRAVNSPDNGYDSQFVEHNYFELAYQTNSPTNLGPDGVQASHGTTIQYNTFRIKLVGYDTSTQHPDYVQAIGNHNKIIGNEFVNIGDSAIDVDMWANPTLHDWIIANNLFRITQDVDPGPEYIRIYSSQATMISINNFLIANNTFIDNGYNNIRLIWKGNPTLSGFAIENNIWVNAAPYEIADDTTFSTSPIIFSHNIYYPSSTAISYRCAAGGGFTACNNYTATTWSAIEPTRILGLPVFASYTYRSTGNDLHLTAGDTVAQGQALDLSPYFTADHDGVTRAVPWSIGAYQGSYGPTPGIISLSSSIYETSETNSNIALVFHRTGGSSGAVSVNYATADGTATAGVNYTAASGTMSWPNGVQSDNVVNVFLANTGFLGQKQFTFGIGSPGGGATLGSTTNATVVLDGSGSPAPLAGTSWPATDGQISAPFTKTGTSYISQSVETQDPSVGGLASYTFTNNIGTNLVVLLSVNAPADGANSIFVNFGSLPTVPTMISDIYPVTNGFTNYVLNWRGSGTFDNNEFVPKVFTVSTGLLTLSIVGREPGVQIEHVTVQAPSTNRPPPVTNSLPAPSALQIAPLTSMVGSPYTDPQASAHTHTQIRIFSASGAPFWDSGVLGPVESWPSPRMDLNTGYQWQIGYENALGLWGWSTVTPFEVRSGTILNVRQVNAGLISVRN